MNMTLRRAAAARASGPQQRPPASNVRRPAPARHVTLRLFLLLPLFAFLSPVSSAQTQTPAPFPTPPDPLVIDLTQPLRDEQKFYLGGKVIKEEIPVQMRGDERQWWLFQFEKLPREVSLKVRDNHRGYVEGQRLKEGTWYPVRTNLKLQLSFDQPVTSPVSLRLRTGYLNETARGEVGGYESEDVRAYVNDRNHSGRVVEHKPNSFTIDFYYGQVLIDSTSSESTSTSPAPTSTQAHSVTAPTQDIIAYWPYVVFIFAMVALFVLWLIRKRDKKSRHKTSKEEWEAVKDDKTVSVQGVKRGVLSRLLNYLPGRGGQQGESLGSQPHDLQSPHERVRPSQITETEVTTPMPASMMRVIDSQTLQTAFANEFGDVKGTLNKFDQKLNLKLDSEAETVYQLIRAKVKADIEAEASALRTVIVTHRRELDTSSSGLKRELEDRIEGVKKDVEKAIAPVVQEELKPVRERQEAILNLLKQAAAERDELTARLKVAEQAAGLWADTMYNAKVLGFMLTQRVDVLREDNFNALMDELEGRLKKFFAEEVGRNGEGGLDELKERADALLTAFRAVVEKMSELKAEGEGEARLLAERVSAAVAELSALNTQLKERQLDIKATIHIPVSAHARARRTFLEELGSVIQQEVTKLSDPLVHFESELEKIATSEVIGLADLCDRCFRPGASGELETLLKKLFDTVGLEDIVPETGGNFETGRQELLGMVDGQPQQSLKVAQVFSRGFVYSQNGRQTLLRKAGVKIYR